MKTWTAMLNSWTTLRSAHRWVLCIGLFTGVCLMSFYMQVLNAHMVHADQVRLGQRTGTNTLTVTVSTRR
jgi:hypothetical protein